MGMQNQCTSSLTDKYLSKIRMEGFFSVSHLREKVANNILKNFLLSLTNYFSRLFYICLRSSARSTRAFRAQSKTVRMPGLPRRHITVPPLSGMESKLRSMTYSLVLVTPISAVFVDAMGTGTWFSGTESLSRTERILFSPALCLACTS